MKKGVGTMWKKNASIRKLLIWVFSLFAAVVLLLLICMDWYLIMSYQMAKREQENAIVQNAAGRVRTDMERISNTVYDFYTNNADFKALTGKVSDLERFSHSYDLNEVLKARLAQEESLHGHFLFYNNGRSSRLFVKQDVIASEDVNELKEQIKDRMVKSNVNWKWYYTVVNGSKYGMLMVRQGNVTLCEVYNLSYKENVLQASAPEKSRLFFVQADGGLTGEGDNILVEELHDRSGSYSRKDADSFFSAYEIGKNGLWLCMEIRVDLFFYMSGGQLLLLFVTVFAVLGILMVHFQMNRYLVLPLLRLEHTMNLIRDGEWEAKVESAHFEEIQKVNDALETMVGEIRKQKILAYEQMLEKQQTQMRFLQLQLKPHFYLNGLKTLNAMVMEQDWRSTQDMIISLSEHMRYLLQAERETVPLAAEVDFVKNYAQLQKNMTSRPFHISWDIQSVHRDWYVPILCIQTFLENSFKYAKMGSVQKELLIRIAVRELETEEGAYLDITLRDNGCGYPEAVLDNINESPNRDGPGVGIKNLQRRCELLYSGRAQYNFFNENGAVSELSLPWNGGENHEHIDCG